MFRPLLLLLAALLVGGCATSSHGVAGKGKHMTIRTTAYTANEPGGSKGATGERLHFGGNSYSAASDWSWMPLGTRFRMLQNGRTYVIEDYGSALVGRQTVDLFMPDGKSMREWGCRQVEIEIMEWGSAAMSLKLLTPRQANAHVRQMVTSLQKSPGARGSSGPLLARE